MLDMTEDIYNKLKSEDYTVATVWFSNKCSICQQKNWAGTWSKKDIFG